MGDLFGRWGGECLNGDVKCEGGHKYMCRNGKYEMEGECDCNNGEISDDGQRLCVDKNWKLCLSQGEMTGKFGCLKDSGYYNELRWFECNNDNNGKYDDVLLCMNGEWQKCEKDGVVVGSFACMGNVANSSNKLRWIECNAEESEKASSDNHYYCMDKQWYVCKNNGQYGLVVGNRACVRPYESSDEIQWVECNDSEKGMITYNDLLLCMDGKWQVCDGSMFCIYDTLYYCDNGKWYLKYCASSGCGGC